MLSLRTIFTQISKIIPFVRFKTSRIFSSSCREKTSSLTYPVEASPHQKLIIAKALSYSMTNVTRMWALIQAYEYVVARKIPGDFVECGVWKGGNLMLLSDLQAHTGEKRNILGFDTFSGMTEPSSEDYDYRGIRVADLLGQISKIDGGNSIHAMASLEMVQSNLLKNNAQNVKLISGDVANTLRDKSNLPEQISILRLDTDWFESTKIELEILYPLLAPGGVLIIDDYGHYSGARKAVDDYFKFDRPWLHFVDYTCRLMVKKF
jgi:O-methyltransferase